MVFLPGITSSWMRNPLEEFFSARNCQLMDEVSNGGMVIPLGITSSWMRNQPEEGDNAGNYQLIDADSGRQDQNAWKILCIIKNTGLATQNPLFRFCQCQLFWKFKYKNIFKRKNEHDQALLRTSYLSK
jgi:hypothetical protein